jgi:hypothetical protein
MLGKNKSWKHRSTCQNCGTVFAGRSDGANRFCKNDCQHEFSVSRWLACSRCLAAVGIGSKTSARLLGVTAGNISRQWKKFEIVAQRPSNGSWFNTIRKQQSSQSDEESRLWRLYETAWMRDIKQAGRGFDWSFIWNNEQNNRKLRERYNSPESIYERACYREILQHRMQSIYPDWSSLWHRSRMAMKPHRKAVDNLRTRFKSLVKTVKGGGSSCRSNLIGCTTVQLRIHLESQFKRGMTWENYGTRWHVDHIIPCAAWDHTDQEQVRRCWHWTNLRPLDAKKNMEKSDTVTEPQMHLLLCATH